MRILGIDSATTSASVALTDNDDLIGEEICQTKQEGNGTAFPGSGQRAEIILPLINTALEKHRITLDDLSAIAVSIGPGSFTGLRVGLATAKGIAYSGGLPVIGISTLLASAARVTNFEGLICSLLDARKKEVYFGLFRRNGEAFSRLANDGLSAIDCAIELMRDCQRDLGGATLMAIGDGAEAYKQALMTAFEGRIFLTAGHEYRSIAAAVALLARARILAESVDDLGALVPIYLRRSEAEAPKLTD